MVRPRLPPRPHLDGAAGAYMPGECNDKAFLTASELSAQSGLSPSTIYRLKTAGKLPYYQPAGRGGAVLFPPDAIEQSKAEALYASRGNRGVSSAPGQ